MATATMPDLRETMFNVGDYPVDERGLRVPFKIEPGHTHPLGATPDADGVNFALFSEHATCVELLLFDAHDDVEPIQTIQLTSSEHKTFHIWHCYIRGLRPGMHYAYRVDGPREPHKGHRFDPDKLLIDPYARGNTKTLSSKRFRTCKELGVTAVELLPVFEFADQEVLRYVDGGRAASTTGATARSTFFAPHPASCMRRTRGPTRSRVPRHGEGAAPGRHRGHPRRGVQPHRRGQPPGPDAQLQGHRQRDYYTSFPATGQYYNDYTGCGNTFNCNHPVTAPSSSWTAWSTG
jgi:pullulanase/glycogen debranching enzyme